MGDRQRIKNELKGEIILDEFAFFENKGSKNARKITNKTEQLHFEIWFDKHYVNRTTERNGIDETIIKKLLYDSFFHLIHYSLTLKGFSFVNPNGANDHTHRLVIQQDNNTETLNIAVGFYYISDNKYEITVFTAMVVDNFRISDGQFALLIDNNGSTLKKMDNKKLVILASLF
ncbi:MAG: hypothetical protein EAZ15_07595 [Sphingobacteriales bacterium]|nr:MAG: hypothetical protein EAZ15_07595 [Sphingobacteriales bacterium]